MTDQLQQLQHTMSLDGYALEVTEDGDRRVATITAGEGVCGDCLVPKVVMTNLLAKALAVDPDRIDLHYPVDLDVPADAEPHLV